MGRLSQYTQPSQIFELPVESIEYSEGKISEVIFNDKAKKYRLVFTYTDLELTQVDQFESFDGGSTYVLIKTESFNYTDGIFTGTTI